MLCTVTYYRKAIIRYESLQTEQLTDIVLYNIRCKTRLKISYQKQILLKFMHAFFVFRKYISWMKGEDRGGVNHPLLWL